jgi:hypothetical protein
MLSYSLSPLGFSLPLAQWGFGMARYRALSLLFAILATFLSNSANATSAEILCTQSCIQEFPELEAARCTLGCRNYLQFSFSGCVAVCDSVGVSLRSACVRGCQLGDNLQQQVATSFCSANTTSWQGYNDCLVGAQVFRELRDFPKCEEVCAQLASPVSCLAGAIEQASHFGVTPQPADKSTIATTQSSASTESTPPLTTELFVETSYCRNRSIVNGVSQPTIFRACLVGQQLYNSTPSELICKKCFELLTTTRERAECQSACQHAAAANIVASTTSVTTTILMTIDSYLSTQCSIYSGIQSHYETCRDASNLFQDSEAQCFDTCQIQYFDAQVVEACFFGCDAVRRYLVNSVTTTLPSTGTNFSNAYCRSCLS